jgi:GDPmannose 4,6-dehydratase
MATALITGITGQDGSYLAELLLTHGYDVIGTVRPGCVINDANVRSIRDRLNLVEANLLDERSIRELVDSVRPDEIYNLAARASSRHLFENPVLTGDCNGLAVARILEAIHQIDSGIRFCQASSSEMFGNAAQAPQDESTPFQPRNPYGIAKLSGHWFAVNYRQSYGVFACSAILFNHESPRRGAEFVTRKITSAAARIKAGLQEKLVIADLEARRDWGFAGDYVQAMWQMLRAPEPGDYVIATGKSHSVREFCEVAFGHLGLDYADYVLVDAVSSRPRDSVSLVGNATKATRVLGWRPGVDFEGLVKMMVDADMQSITDGGADR